MLVAASPLPILDQTQTGLFGFIEYPGMIFDLPGPAPSGLSDVGLSDVPMGLPTPESGHNLTQSDLDFSQDLLGKFQLPAHEQLMELVELFFDHLYTMFPCFHKANFLARVHNGELEGDSPLLLLTVCCVTARYHPDAAIKEREKDWYDQARFTYELTQRRPYPGLRTIQAVILLVFHACTVGDFSASWLFLGKAWRQAVVLGMNRMDASHAVAMGLNRADADVSDERFYGLENSEAHTAVEKEEYRRTLWLMFMMDRTHAWPTGWPHAITETQFKVDFPIASTLFQAMDPAAETSVHENTPFMRSTRHLGRLIDSISSAKDPLNTFHYIAVAHVLLGRVAELVHSLYVHHFSLLQLAFLALFQTDCRHVAV